MSAGEVVAGFLLVLFNVALIGWCLCMEPESLGRIRGHHRRNRRDW